MIREGYDIAQVCINGHVINSNSLTYPTKNKKFCDKCGEGTITTCKNYGASIKGSYLYPVIINSGLGYKLPNFCDNCGHQYPWTEIKLKASVGLINLSENLDDEEKVDLNNCIEDLVKENSNVPVALLKLKKYLGKAGQEIALGIKDILIDIVSETIKKSIWSQ